MKRIALTFVLCLTVSFVLFAQDIQRVERKKPSFQPSRHQQNEGSHYSQIILMPEINFITHLKSMDEDVRLDSMMRAHNYQPINRKAPPKEIAYVGEDGFFVAGYNEESKNLILSFVIRDYEQYSQIRKQLMRKFKKVDNGTLRYGNDGEFFTESYSLGAGLGTIDVGYSNSNKFIIHREIMIPNYYWNVTKYQ